MCVKKEDDVDVQIQQLLQRIAASESNLLKMKSELRDLMERRLHEENEISQCHSQAEASASTFTDPNQTSSDPSRHKARRWPLEQREYRRYGRQLILPEIGSPGQVSLKNARVLVIGLGGLGCPAAAYLAGAGVGTIGLVDGDVVEESNLHRQIAHSTTRIGWNKATSAAHYLQDLNPLVKYNVHREHLTAEKAIPLFARYDLVLDCTDHPTSRYLISDACVISEKPLVSASALKTEGQLIVLNNPPRSPGDSTGGPCYRCLFPKPPPPETMVTCGEGGILGPVVAVMGVLQALEAIKILSSLKESTQSSPRPTLLLYSAYSDTLFRVMKMRSRRADCAACSSTAIVSAESLVSGSMDYVAFCAGTTNHSAIPAESRVSAKDFNTFRQDKPGIVLDLRDSTQYNICHLDRSINVPWTGNAKSWIQKTRHLDKINSADGIFLICRLGNDSQLAVAALMDTDLRSSKIMDVRGGFKAWREDVDETWPDY